MKFFYLLVILFSELTIYATESISITSMSSDEITQKRFELDKIFKDGSLDEGAKSKLNDLRAKAGEVAQMNDRCQSFSISSVPDPRCKDFLIHELPAFVDEYAKLTGELYFNKIKVQKGLNQRMTQINGCIEGMESFLNNQYLAQNLISLTTEKQSIEPIDAQNFEMTYQFKISFLAEKEAEFKQRVRLWSEVCSEVIQSTDEASFAPYFKSQLLAWLGTSDWSVLIEKNDIYIHPKYTWNFNYFLNQNKLFEVKSEQVVWTQQMLHLFIDDRVRSTVQMNGFGDVTKAGKYQFKKENGLEVQGQFVGAKNLNSGTENMTNTPQTATTRKGFWQSLFGN